MNGGSVLNGTAAQGGNLRGSGTSKIIITGGIVSGGTATTECKNIFTEDTATCTINGGTVDAN